MKRILLVWLIFLSLAAGAQTYNNEWIDYSKTYYKFKVAANGLYRLPQSLLASVDLAGINADHFQLWRNGKQVPIYTSVQNAPLGAGDYIEFWGEMNDGKPDNPLYREPGYQISDHFSLQTDTAAYFLTVNTTGGNFRLAPTPNDVIGNSLLPEPFLMYTVGNYRKNQVNSGRAEDVQGTLVYSSSYDNGEGWAGAYLGPNKTETTNFTGLAVYTGAGAPAATLQLTMCGALLADRRYRVRLNNDSLIGGPMDNFEMVKTGKEFPVSAIATNSASVQITNLGVVPTDLMVTAQIELTYPRKPDFGGSANFIFQLPANIAGNYLEVTNFNAGGSIPVLYDLTNGRRYVMNNATPGKLRVVLQPSAVNRNLVMVSEAASNIKTIAAIEQRNFVDYSLPVNQGDYLIITNSLLTSASGPGDPVEDYRQYRSSAEGGGFTAKVFLMDQLVDQYAFGIKMHPLSVRNFIRRARDKNAITPKYILLIGKAVVYTSYNNANQSLANMEKLQLVPTFGNPASDNLLSAQGNSSIPLTPIGRLSAINKSEITAYLNKVKSYEQQAKATSPVVADAGWKKSVIHVTGASDEATATILSEALDGHKRIIEDTAYGGIVSTFSKTSADAVEQVSATQIGSMFKAGVGILTYFGHSSATTLEFNLDDPEAYDNSGKYPIFIVMGCNAGNFYLYNEARLVVKETISENYILTADRGAVAFLASTHLGVVHYLDIYNTRFYRAMSTTKYGGSLGQIMDEAIAQMLASSTAEDFYARFQCEQFTLHGDPAVKPYHFEKPDLAIEAPMVKVTPSFIPISETDFKVVAQYVNMGKSVNRSFVVTLKRTYPNNTTEVIRKDTVVLRGYTDSLTYTLPISAVRDVGLNKITVTLDDAGELDELYETNNSVTKDVYIIEDDVRPVSPYTYSIINEQNPKLIASSANPFAPARNYRVEVDTAQTFTSPLATSNATSTGGVFEFSPSLNMTDSTVYYWRVSPAAVTGEPVWNNSSFQYISNGLPGFSQAHYYQFLKNKFENLSLEEDRKFHFTESKLDIDVTASIYPYGKETGSYMLSINSVRAQGGLNGPLTTNANSLRFYVIDGKTSKPWVNKQVGSGGLYGSYAPIPFNATVLPGYFVFDISTTAARQTVMDFIDMIPAGDYILITNSIMTSTVLPSVWLNDTTTLGSGVSLYHKIQSLGITDLSSMTTWVPFIFAVKKGNTTPIRQIVAEHPSELLKAIFEIRGIHSVAHMESEAIGPSKRWGTLKWKGTTPGSGNPEVKVLGIMSNGQVDTLLTVPENQQETDLTDVVDAAVYPNIKLRLQTIDSVNFIPFQLKYWMVQYDPVPEGAIASNLFVDIKDTVDIGEPLNVGIGFKNVSNVPFDSLAVRVVLTDKNNVDHVITVPKQKPLAKNEVLQFSIPVDTKTFSGENTLYINFNPDKDQPEIYTFNNYAFKKIYVRPDTLQPLLDVTFDGVHILNNDIVSAKPSILVKLKDEAKWMPLDDPNLLSVQVKFPDGSTRSYSFTNTDTLQFHAANQPPNTDNTASIDFKPFLEQDGNYELIITAKDKSDNSAGNVAYRVDFQVINKPMISNMLNYPNPFTTSTAFVFTLTGSEVPQNLRIQILTITGKIVRDITKQELGPIHIGRNITEFKWDGTDQYGQKLANGVYLYRVITNQHGKTLDKYKAANDNTDKYFNNGYGKMYLMR